MDRIKEFNKYQANKKNARPVGLKYKVTLALAITFFLCDVAFFSLRFAYPHLSPETQASLNKYPYLIKLISQ